MLDRVDYLIYSIVYRTPETSQPEPSYIIDDKFKNARAISSDMLFGSDTSGDVSIISPL